jgi:CRP-like cAMP-binding protein
MLRSRDGAKFDYSKTPQITDRIDQRELVALSGGVYTIPVPRRALRGHNRKQADLVDQLFDSSEQRLARALLLLSRAGKEAKTETVIPQVSRETLAEMVGATRSRVNFFMNEFRKLDFIDYDGGLEMLAAQRCPAQVCYAP